MAAIAWNDLMDRLGGSAKANSAVNAQREGWGRDPNLEGMDPSELAEFDRYTHGVRFGQDVPPIAAPLLLPAAAGLGTLNELSKLSAPAQAAIARITGDRSFMPSQATSAPSLGNALALLRGAWEGMAYRR